MLCNLSDLKTSILSNVSPPNTPSQDTFSLNIFFLDALALEARYTRKNF